MDSRVAQIIEIFTKSIGNIFEANDLIKIEDLIPAFKQPTDEFLRTVVKAYIEIIDETLVSQKQERKEKEITVHKRDVSREILFGIGGVYFKRTYFKTGNEYCYLADNVVSLEAYDRIGLDVSSELVTKAAYMSYQKSATLTTDVSISRQTVSKKIRTTKGLETIPTGKKSKVKALHIVADEDHTAMQRGKNRIKAILDTATKSNPGERSPIGYAAELIASEIVAEILGHTIISQAGAKKKELTLLP